jgi:hypothetical protein
MGTKYYIPKLYCPFPDKVHPRVSEVEKHVVEWMIRHNIVVGPVEQERFASSKIAWLAARTAPCASDDFLEILADWMMWLFAFDDAYSEESDAGRRTGNLMNIFVEFLRVLDDPLNIPEVDTPFVASLRDLRLRLASQTTAVQLRRFIGTVQAYFFAQVWEAEGRAGGTWPTVENYLSMRVDSGAVPTCIALADAADGFILSEEDLARDDIRSLTRMAVNVTCWANDIYSYRKEVERSTEAYNLPVLLMRSHGHDLQEALNLTAAMHDGEVRKFLHLEAEILSDASEELSRYVASLRSWMRGNLTWSTSTGRYNEGAPQTAGKGDLQ